MDTKKIEEAVKMIIEAVGEDENREGLQETPTRIAKMYQEIFAGLGQTAEEHLSKSFEIIDNNMVVEKDIFFHSMCEHHFCHFMEKCTLPTFQMAVWLGFQNWLVRSRFMLKTTDSGTFDGRNRRCLDGISWSARCPCLGRSRAYVYEYAWCP